MPIFLPKEFETEICGLGDGSVCITQKQGDEEVQIFLTIHQFETIFNYEKRILKEAWGHEHSDDQL
tara:strand:- start:72 stop:269 length:198 start_codon:yes stop_codon:yes gene_type:complete